MLYGDYEILVMQDYEKKKAGNALHSGLIEPTPAGIRDACRAVWLERYEKSDEKALKEFFKYHGEPSAWPRIIDEYPTGKFKALKKFLDKDTESTKRTNIELLAWLIDFRPRPFVIGNTIKVTQTGQEEIQEREKTGKQQETATQTAPEPYEGKSGPSGGTKKGAPKRNIKYWIAIGLLILLIPAAITYFWPKSNKPLKVTLTGYEKCMFWDEDRYQPTDCQKRGDTLVIPLDSNMLLHFRKIMQPDTITTNSIGKLWYVRYRGYYEFYTSDGFHPIDPQLRLKPITEYIINRHVPANP
jgi:hypothetical protein